MKSKNCQVIYKKFQDLHKKTYTAPISSYIIFLENHELIQNDSDFLFSLKIREEYCNIHKSLYGGAASTILDYTTSFCLMINDKNQFRKSLSLNLTTNFVYPAFCKEEIFIRAKTKKIGKNIGHSEFEMLDRTQKILCYGTHMAFMKDPLIFEDGKFVKDLI